MTVPYRPTKLSAGVDKRGQPIPRTEIDPAVDGTLLRGHDDQLVGAELQPRYRTLYVNGSHGFSIGYLMPNEETGNVEDDQGGGGTGLWSESMLLALDYRNGKVRWSRTGPPPASATGSLDSGWPGVHQ